MTGFENNKMCRAMGCFAGLEYDQIGANDKPNYMIRATYAALLVRRPCLVSQLMKIPKTTLRKKNKTFAKKVKDLAKQTTNLIRRLRLTVAHLFSLTDIGKYFPLSSGMVQKERSPPNRERQKGMVTSKMSHSMVLFRNVILPFGTMIWYK